MGGEALVWRARHVAWEIRRPLVMGILNVTPDSFSDGGAHFGEESAVAHGLRLAEEGADLLDIGGESTRPGARPVDAEEEWRRIGTVVSRIARKDDIPISVDTYKPEVARKAIRAGAVIVNDVHGLRDPEMARIVGNSAAGAVVMHMQGEPPTMQREPTYIDLVAEVIAFLDRQIESAGERGVSPEALVLDPGFGFGKTPAHNTELLRRLAEVRSLGRPVLAGVSGKLFLGTAPAADGRDVSKGGSATAVAAIQRGADIVRMHDVAGTVRLLRRANDPMRTARESARA